MFTEAKFRSLSAPHQAKRIAELLRTLIANEREDWKRGLVEYRELSNWAGDRSHPLDPQTLQVRPMVEAYVHWREKAGLGPERSLWSAFNSDDAPESAAPALPWTVWMHNLRSAHNVGSAIRTADCMGLAEVWLSGYCAPLENAALKSAAMGAEKWLPVRRFEGGVPEALAEIERRGLPLVALETDPDGDVLGECEWPEGGVLAIGNEELGLEPAVLERATRRVRIPMFGRKASMNVANAFALAAWEIRRTAKKEV